MHLFALVLIVFNPDSGYHSGVVTQAGPYVTMQACTEARDAAMKQDSVARAFCVQVDKPQP